MERQIRNKYDGVPLGADLCLLICSMFPENSRIPIEDLVLYMMGLNLSEDVHDLFEARYRVHNLIPIAEVSNKIRLCRVIDDHDNQYVKMLKGAIDLAKSTASRCKLVFRCQTVVERWPTTNWYTDCYGLLLVLRKITEYPVYLKCPKLALLQLQYDDDSQSLPVDFFEGMKELLVLSLSVPSLPKSLIMLKNLRTLCLKLVNPKDMSAIGGLTNLQFLSISTSCSTGIPREMERLSNLRLLDLRKMLLAYIPQGVLSKLLKLEELYLPTSFTRWGCRVEEEEDVYDKWVLGKNDAEERINANLSEIGALPLNLLQICVPDVALLPKKSPMFKRIRQFKILVPDHLKYQLVGKGSMNELQLTGGAFDIEESGICDLMSRTEDLTLTRVKNLNNVNNGMHHLKDNKFRQLKKLIITECEELECLFDTGDWIECGSFWGLRSLHLSMLPNLKEIWHGLRTGSHFEWFINLRRINIRFCHKLNYVFPMSIARRLKRLQIIEILDCNKMDGILYRDDVESDTKEVYFVEELNLHSLPKLVGFLRRKDDSDDRVNDHSYESAEIEKVPLINDNGAASYMENCAFASKLMTKLVYLQKLRIAYCDAIEVIFSFEENHDYDSTWVLNSLKELELYGLQSLRHIWYQIPSDIPAFKNLQVLILSECHNTYLLSPRVAKHLVQLQKMQISRCKKMEEIVSRDYEEGEQNTEKIVFPQLKILELQHMPSLRIFYGEIYEVELPSLSYLKINQCNKMESFCCGSLHTPILEKVQLNGSLCSVMGNLNDAIKWLNAEIL